MLEETTETNEPVVPAPERQRLFARERSPDPEETAPEPAAAHAGGETATTAPLKPRRRGGKARAEEKQD